MGGGGGGGNAAPKGLSGVERVGVSEPKPDFGLEPPRADGECAVAAGEPNVSVGGDGVPPPLLQLPREPASIGLLVPRAATSGARLPLQRLSRLANVFRAVRPRVRADFAASGRRSEALFEKAAELGGEGG